MVSMPKKKQPQAQKELTAQMRLVPTPDTPSYYVNYVAVSHTAYDFTLSVGKIPTPPSAEQLEIAKKGEPIPVEPILQLIIPPLLIDGIIKALEDQKAKHEITLANQVKNNEQQYAKQQQHAKPVDPIN